MTDSEPEPAPTPPTAPRPVDRVIAAVRTRAGGWLVAAGMAAALVIAAGFAISATLTRAAPGWWNTPRDDETARARATAMENAAVSELYRARPRGTDGPPAESAAWMSETWSVGLLENDINAWLAARMPRWLEGRPGLPDWPPTMSQLQVRFDNGAVRAGVRVDTPDGPRFVTASFRPEIDDRGSLWLRASWVHIGRLPVPASWVIGSGDDGDGVLPPELLERPEAALFLGMARGDAPVADAPLVRLEDRRRVRLLGVRVRPGRLELTMRTEARVGDPG